ncbi:TonB-dependent receptor [Mucilaginibacter paludis]|uniref:TonB-dependent receptor plug n=1 Tax=Mucilaginibacter paludis DSM 18603 TaxID=714943 RepID=H1Y6C5_9SPHI|nr:TonB-dependent receptor [Mucilaginibacter paludis]EHQ24873.1 TonB-dependent receptor plug [Mucilaginibacter paludis DSM 18603]
MKKSSLLIRQIMRISFLVTILLFVFSQILWAARSDAQTIKQKVSIAIGNESLDQALAQFGKTTHLQLAYDGTALGLKKYTVKAKNFSATTAAEVLEYLLQNTNITYKETSDGIVLVPKTRLKQGKITGIVLDEKGEALPGATVVVVETGAGTQTKPDGTFSIPVQVGTYTLKISFIAYQTLLVKNVVVEDGKETHQKIALQSDNSKLNEVVVVGYGSKLKSEITGAVSSISSKDLANRPITQASQALYGLVPGVYLNTSTGEAGNNQATIRIRGIGTLNDASALILVDGIEAPLDNINPTDIESISVLKDASSAAIYGSRAANGVVLVTTKRGKLNSKPTIDYTAYAGLSAPTVLPQMVTDPTTYLQLYREAALNSGTKVAFTDADIARYASQPSTNWLDVAFKKTAPIQQHTIAVRGGSTNTTYSLSLGYLKQDGIIKGNQDYNAYNIRSNIDNTISKKLKVGSSIAYSYGLTNLTPKDVATQIAGNAIDNTLTGKGNLAFEGGLMQHPIVPVYDGLGRYATLEQALGLTSSRNNEQAILNNEYAVQKDNRLLGNVYAEYEIIKDLKVKGTVGYNYQQMGYVDTRKEFSQYDPVSGALVSTVFPGSQLYDIQRNSQNVTAFLQSTYEKQVGLHNFKALIGYNQESSVQKQNTVEQLNFGSTDLITLGSGATTPVALTTQGEWALRSFFGRFDYNFDNKYLFEFNFRRDGSSRFGANNRYGNFPSVSGGWLISNEKFWDVKFFDLLKLRASWGKLGNQNTALYPFASQVALTSNYSFNNNINTGGAISVLGNPDLKWEQTTSTDIGIDMGFFKSKLTVSGDYFIKNTTGILTQITNPLTLGITNPTIVNAAAVQNKGWEADVNYQDKIGKVSIGAGFNFTYVNNVVKSINPSLSGAADQVELDHSADSWLIRGQPIGVIYGYQVQGIFQNAAEIAAAPNHSKLFGVAPQPGDFRIADINGDGVIDSKDRTVIGNRQPKLLYGFNFKAGYKGFDFSALFQGIGHADIYLSRSVGPFPFAGIRSVWLNRWTPENPSTTYPRLWIDRNGYNGSTIEINNASYWVQNRAYLRLKNVQLAYTIPKSVLSKTFIQNLRVYVNAQNLLTFTPLKDFDPERQDQTQYGTSSLPQLKIFTAGLNLTF